MTDNAAPGGRLKASDMNRFDPTDVCRSVEDLARVIIRIVDNGGETADRYSICMTDGDCLMLSGNPSHPQGVSMWGEYDPMAVEENVRDNGESDLRLSDLPDPIVNHIMLRVNEAYREYAREQMDDEGRTREDILSEIDEWRHDLCGPELQRDVI